MSWTQARTEIASHKFPQRLIIIYFSSDIYQCLFLLSHIMLVPKAGPCPALDKHVRHFPLPRMTYVLILLSILPLFFMSLQYLPPSKEDIHFVLLLLKMCLICKFTLMNSINFQTKVFSLSSTYISRFSVLGLFHWFECMNGIYDKRRKSK